MAFNIPDTPEELLRQSKKNFDQFNKLIPFVVLVGLVLAVILSSFYSIGPDEVGVIRRFGKYERTTGPGLQWKLPLGIDALDKVKVEKVFKEEFGFRTLQAGVNTQYSKRSYQDESLMLTGDLNVLEVPWVVQFKIKDPVATLFNVRDPRENVRDLSEAVMRQVVGDRSLTEALDDRRSMAKEMQDKLQAALDSYNAGIYVQTVELQGVNVPDEVKDSFNKVNEAEQEREKVINQAWEVYNKIIPKARGEAEQTIQEAEGYALTRVNRAKGDASQFVATWEAYKSAKDVTRRRLYLETLTEVLPKVGKKYIMEPGGNNVLPLLPLTKEAL